jgi:hypothetical protein
LKNEKKGERMTQEFYTDYERKLMDEFSCRIMKMCVCMDGAAKLAAQEALDEAIHNFVKGSPYIEKRLIFPDAFTATVIVFETEDGMSGWLKKFPSDIRFIEKDWGDQG